MPLYAVAAMHHKVYICSWAVSQQVVAAQAAEADALNLGAGWCEVAVVVMTSAVAEINRRVLPGYAV